MALTNQPAPAVLRETMAPRTPTLHGKEAAGQTWTAGAFLQDNDSGLLVESTTALDGTNTVAKRTIGLALVDATGTTSHDVMFVPLFINPGLLIEMTLSDSTAGTHTLAQTDQWKCYPIVKATDNWYLDANAVSDKGGGIVVGFVGAVGDVDARVLVWVTRTVIAGANAGSFLTDEAGAATYSRGW